MAYVYGMRLRGFAPGCQPKDGFMGLFDLADVLFDGKKYWDVLEYNRKLSEKELADYELDYLGKVVI